MFWILALVSYLRISSPFVLSCTRSSRTSLDALDAVKRLAQGIHAGQWIDLDLNHMPEVPEADFSVPNSHVISAYRTGIETKWLCPTMCVFLCHFLLSLILKNSDKWVWLSNLIRKSSNFKIVMHFGIVYLWSNHLCVIYRHKFDRFPVTFL